MGEQNDRDAGLGEVETWTVEGRWFASVSRASLPPEPADSPDGFAASEMFAL